MESPWREWQRHFFLWWSKRVRSYISEWERIWRKVRCLPRFSQWERRVSWISSVGCGFVSVTRRERILFSYIFFFSWPLGTHVLTLMAPKFKITSPLPTVLRHMYGINEGIYFDFSNFTASCPRFYQDEGEIFFIDFKILFINIIQLIWINGQDLIKETQIIQNSYNAPSIWFNWFKTI